MANDDEQVSSLRAIAHPVRLRILSLLTGTAMSAAEIARELGLTHANASYHLRVLADAGEVVEAGEEHIRGGVAKRYRHPWERTPAAGKPVRRDEAAYVRAMADELVRRNALRKPRSKTLMTDAELWVAPEVWSQVLDLLRQASALVHEQARPPRTEGTVRVNLTAAAFQLSEPAADDDDQEAGR
ncbi:MAG: ArsR/SmtB family transcription factor [Nocardioidaceae bacterium]